jgi:ubiquinone/menaquinone biosynthesis C-methylase UbiE
MDKKQAISIIRETRDNYNTIAKEWDQSRFQPSPVKLKMLKSGIKVLDLGCGNGVLTKVALKKFRHYVGMDISRELLNIAKKKYNDDIKQGRAEFVLGDVQKLPFKDEEFDFIISCAMLHHIPTKVNQQKVLNEVWRVLKKGGSAVFIDWNLFNEWCQKRFSIKKQLKKSPVDWETGDLTVPWKATSGKIINRFIHIFTPEELKELASIAGFKNPRVYYYSRAGIKTVNGEEIVLKIKK